jgi:hypothetical protein
LPISGAGDSGGLSYLVPSGTRIAAAAGEQQAAHPAAPLNVRGDNIPETWGTTSDND